MINDFYVEVAVGSVVTVGNAEFTPALVEIFAETEVIEVIARGPRGLPGYGGLVEDLDDPGTYLVTDAAPPAATPSGLAPSPIDTGLFVVTDTTLVIADNVDVGTFQVTAQSTLIPDPNDPGFYLV